MLAAAAWLSLLAEVSSVCASALLTDSRVTVGDSSVVLGRTGREDLHGREGVLPASPQHYHNSS